MGMRESCGEVCRMIIQGRYEGSGGSEGRVCWSSGGLLAALARAFYKRNVGAASQRSALRSLSISQLIAEEHHPVFKTGCKICLMSQVAFQHLT